MVINRMNETNIKNLRSLKVLAVFQILAGAIPLLIPTKYFLQSIISILYIYLIYIVVYLFLKILLKTKENKLFFYICNMAGIIVLVMLLQKLNLEMLLLESLLFFIFLLGVELLFFKKWALSYSFFLAPIVLGIEFCIMYLSKISFMPEEITRYFPSIFFSFKWMGIVFIIFFYAVYVLCFGNPEIKQKFK
jgi:hypothetical protein